MALACIFVLVRADIQGRPRQDSNLRHRLRRPVLYPLSYEGGGPKCEHMEHQQDSGPDSPFPAD